MFLQAGHQRDELCTNLHCLLRKLQKLLAISATPTSSDSCGVTAYRSPLMGGTAQLYCAEVLIPEFLNYLRSMNMLHLSQITTQSMGRPRKDPKDKHLPPRVTKNRYSYVWKPKGTKQSVTLAPITGTSMSRLWARYEEEKAKRSDVMTFSKLWKLFTSSPAFAELAPRTQTDYRSYEKNLVPVFGNMRADDIKIEMVRIYMDKRGQRSINQANQELGGMSRVFSWGYERGYVKGNPCKGVRKFSLKARDVYVTDEEYQAIYEEAAPALRVGMEISYLCAARVSDVLSLKWSQVSEEGIFIQQGKTGTKQIKVWTERLHNAIELAKTLGGRETVICSSKKTKYSKSGFNDLWETAREAAGKKLDRKLPCTFHDLKAKGISDYEGSSKDKQLFSGHKTESQVVIYDRKVKISPTLDLPNIQTVKKVKAS